MAKEDRDVHYLEARNPDLPIIVAGAVAQGILAVEDVGEPARELVAGVAESLRAVMDKVSSAAPRDAAAGERYDENAPVSVAAIVGEIDMIRDDSTLYVNRRTGDVRVMSHEYLPDEDEPEEEEPADAADWEREAMEEGREVVSNPDWVALLGRFDVDDLDVMRRFARDASPAASRDLLEALHGRGACRRFRDEVRRRGLQKEWDTFQESRRAEHVRFELHERGIAFRK